MSARTFLDTNVLVYQFDQTAPVKQRVAQDLIERQLAAERAVISSQVVQEFMSLALRKFTHALTADELEVFMQKFLEPLCQHTPTFDFYERALVLYKANSLNFYDALIIQAAIDLGCSTLYSEDLQDGQQFGDLIISNPFN